MGDMGDYYRDWRDHKKEQRRIHTEDCPTCPTNRNPTKLWPGQTCLVCGYKRPNQETST